ncbi:acetyl-CoA hydrolase/transferase family protein [Dietzia sp. PP-33]|jgi:acyl-CoA hydrolase|uniref:acetyl-CoA hydrolase/transferase family protein n=1 Tax=Dietzia sp. PP-33 TaxID=2957500 RepID=UPI0029BD836B|nr:acetyl-CoA hydrolase/transferase C-terminal domain-containing protein [Dietzia sp. PP-33]MDX2355793.1 propionyl-CoA--succinate CoA transferase [Dietzia sp. PP-33]
MKATVYDELPAEAVLEHVRPGMHILSPIQNGAPPALLRALDAGAEGFSGVTIHHMDPWESLPFMEGAYPGRLRHVDYFLGPGSRKNFHEGRCDLVPVDFAQVPATLREFSPPGLAVTTVSEIDEHGFFSMGTNADYVASFIGQVPFFVEVNANMPRTFGRNHIHISQVVGVTRNDVPMITIEPPVPGDVESAIADIIAERVPDGACLQLGVGKLPNAFLSRLTGHENLGIHTEALSDGVMDLVDAGVIDGSRKTGRPFKHVTTFAVGSQKLMDWLHNNPSVAMLPVDIVNDPRVIGQEHNLHSVNATSEVDLYGQAASETIGGRYWSGAGGQADFARGCRFSPGGHGFIVTPSQTSGGISRITLSLTPGSPVTTHKNIIDNVVTEYGIAALRGRSVSARAAALIEIAHPDHRERLSRQAREAGLLPRVMH